VVATITRDVRLRLPWLRFDFERGCVLSTVPAEADETVFITKRACVLCEVRSEVKTVFNTSVDEINTWFSSRIKNRTKKKGTGYGVNIKAGRLMTGT
jgi:ribosomal protein L23